MGLRGEVLELRLWREVAQLRFGRQVGELRFGREFSGFGGELRRLRLGRQVPQLGPLRHGGLLRGVAARRRLLEDLGGEAGLIHRRVVDGVDLPQCHFLR